MKCIRIKNLFKAYQNGYVYNDLLHAKEKLFDLNIQIEKKHREIKQLEEQYIAKKNKATLAALSQLEMSVIINKKIENAVCYFLDKFNEKLKKELEKGNLAFELMYENPTDIEIEALKFLEIRLNEENFDIKIAKTQINNHISTVTYITMFVNIKKINDHLKK